MAASSGLRENVYPIIFLTEMLIFIILLCYCINWHRWWSQYLILLFPGTDVNTWLDVSYFILFCFIFISFTFVLYFIFISFIILCLHGCYNAELCCSWLNSLILLCPFMHRCYSAGFCFPYMHRCYGARVIVCLFLTLEWSVIFHHKGVAGYTSQCFCSMWDYLLWCTWPFLLLLPYCGLPCLLS